MKKLLISESQLKVLRNHILTTESKKVNENMSELTLGLLYMVGVELTGQNEVIGQNAVKDPKVIKRIDNVMSDNDKLTDFIDKMEGNIPNIRKLIQNKLGNIEQSIDDSTPKT